MTRACCTTLAVMAYVISCTSSVGASTSASSFTSTSQSTSGPTPLDPLTLLPPMWNTICDVTFDVNDDVDATITCRPTPSDPEPWRLADLRNSRVNLTMAVRLHCEAGGMVSLPWPMRCPGLTRLEVRNCHMLDKYQDFGTPLGRIGDWMQVLDMRDSVWLNDPRAVDHVLRHSENITSDFECGQDSTLRRYIYHNISDVNLEPEDGPDQEQCGYVLMDALVAFNINSPDDLGKVPKEQFDRFVLDAQSQVAVIRSCADRLVNLKRYNINNNTDSSSDILHTSTDSSLDGRPTSTDSSLDTIHTSTDSNPDNRQPNLTEGYTDGIRREDICHDDLVAAAFQDLSLPFPDDMDKVSNEALERVADVVRQKGDELDQCVGLLTDYRRELLDRDTDARDTRIDLDRIKPSCFFEQLVENDESATNPVDLKHFESMVKNTKYPQLRVLNYSYTTHESLPTEIREWRVSFEESPMKLMDFSHCFIREVGNIPRYTPKAGRPRTVLNVQFNNITRVSLEQLRDWAYIPDFYLDIRNNPVDCSCDALDLREIVVKMKKNDAKDWVEAGGPMMARYIEDLSFMTCATPPGLSGRAIGSLSADELSCVEHRISRELLVVIVVLSVLVVILLVLLALAVRYRKEVRILLFTRVHILLPCGRPFQQSADAPDKIYDAFVAYAHEDSDWVIKSLMSRLESPSKSRGSGPLKLCIHERDFIPGKLIIDNVIDSIAASRHTIVVLSHSFVKSGWAMEELQQAYRQSMEERRRHLVVVMLEDVAQSDMAPVLRRVCKTFTYIHVNHSFFWDRLLYSIQVTSNTDRKKRPGQRRSGTSFDNITYDTSDDGGPRGLGSDVESGGSSYTTETTNEDGSAAVNRSAIFSGAMLCETVAVNGTCNDAVIFSKEKKNDSDFNTRL